VEDQLAQLLATGERAAFHGRPAAGVPALEQAFGQARADGRDAEATAAAWLLGVALGACGRLGSALAVLEPLAAQRGTDIPERRLFAALASATAASLYRQLARHEQARDFDEAGLALTDSTGEAAFDCYLGLAADAIGLEDAVAARDYWTRAAAVSSGRVDWWRQRVRLAWTAAELALLQQDLDVALRHADAALTGAEAAGAPRHVAKSLLFVGVAHVQAGRLDEAQQPLRRAGTLADGLGTLPLLWPARALLGALLEESDPAEAARCLSVARGAVIAMADDLPEWLRPVWLDRPDVAALLGGD
jgi:tetratricopeptide (TPR) repeat protein